MVSKTHHFDQWIFSFMYPRTLGVAVLGTLAVAAAALLSIGQTSVAGVGQSTGETLPGAAALMAEYQRPSWIPFPEDNPHSGAKERLGRALYFDPRLSRSSMRPRARPATIPAWRGVTACRKVSATT